jgi:mannose-1-phosphate guanylyltransferase
VFPALLEGDIPFYSHEIDAYWDDIGNVEELRHSNFDALKGAVEIEPGAPQVGEGVRSASELGDAEVDGPVLVGAGVELGPGVRIQGPAILGDGCRVGAGAWVRDSIVLAGAELPDGAMLVGGIAGRLAES